METVLGDRDHPDIVVGEVVHIPAAVGASTVGLGHVAYSCLAAADSSCRLVVVGTMSSAAVIVGEP